MLHGEAGDPDVVQPGGDGHRLPPMGEEHAAGQGGLLDLQPIGDHLVVVGGRDDEFARGLVIRVVDGGQPVPGTIGPVVAEKGAVAVFVGSDDQARSRGAPVAHGVLAALVRPSRLRECDEELVVPVTERDGAVAGGDLAHGHSPSVASLIDQIEAHAGDAIGEKADVDGRLSHDLVCRVIQREAERVIEGVDSGVLGVRVRRFGPARRARQKSQSKKKVLHQ